MLLSFYSQFEVPIITGTKIFTLRRTPKRMPKVGETLHMYTGGYNSSRRLITNKEKLILIQSVRYTVMRYGKGKRYVINVWVDRCKLTSAQLIDFAIYDGFTNLSEWAEYQLGTKNRMGALGIKMFHWTNLKY